MAMECARHWNCRLNSLLNAWGHQANSFNMCGTIIREKLYSRYFEFIRLTGLMPSTVLFGRIAAKTGGCFVRIRHRTHTFSGHNQIGMGITT